MIMYTKIMEDLRETAVMLALASVVFGLLMLSMRYLYGMDFSIIVPMIGRVYVSFFVGMMIFNAYDWIRFARRRVTECLWILPRIIATKVIRLPSLKIISTE